jgi:hypothetical protein
MLRVLNSLLWSAVMSMVIACGAGSMYAAYQAVMSTIAGRSGEAGSTGCIGVGLGVGCYLLCRYSNDLIDR